MKFKDQDCEKQFNAAPIKLKEITLYFATLSGHFGIEPVITRVLEPVSGDSGVHEVHRGIDVRDQVGDEFTYTAKQVNYLTGAMNDQYPRDDGKLVCIHHSFSGGPMHFHLQIPYAWLTNEEVGELNELSKQGEAA